MKKRGFYTEVSYILGLLILSIGTAFMTRADYGVSMVVAPAYLLHLKVSEFLPFFSFGMAEYMLQAVILILMMIVIRRAKLSYFFSFITAIIYGFMLDGALAVIDIFSLTSAPIRLLFYIIGFLFCTMGVSLLFHTYISPEAYELFVKEVSAKFNIDIHKFKTIYDCVSCFVSIAMSFMFFGMWHFEGIKLGTVLCTLVNGFMIRIWTKLFEKIWVFEDRFPLKKYF